MNRTSGHDASKANVDVVHMAKPSSSVFLNATARATPKSSLIAQKPRYKLVIRGKVSSDSVIYSDGWRGYNGLVDVGYGKHFRVDHGNDEFVDGRTHINGIEGFWGYAKSRLTRFRGMSPKTFYLHLKECEFRFNYRGNDLGKMIFRLLRKQPLKLS